MFAGAAPRRGDSLLFRRESSSANVADGSKACALTYPWPKATDS